MRYLLFFLGGLLVLFVLLSPFIAAKQADRDMADLLRDRDDTLEHFWLWDRELRR